MLLTNLIISSLIASSPIALPTMTAFETNRTQFLEENVMINLVSSIALIYTDIYVCTKPHMNTYTTNGVSFKVMNNDDGSVTTETTTYLQKHTEKNPVAKVFFDQGLWDLGFTLANVANIGIVSWMNSWDHTKIASSIYTAVLNTCEVLAISGWNQRFNLGLEIHAPIFTMTF